MVEEIPESEGKGTVVRRQRPTILNVTRGMVIAGLLGAFFESAILLSQFTGTVETLTRAARLRRVAEVGGFAALLAFVAAVTLALAGRRKHTGWPNSEEIAAVSGFLFCLWFSIAFLFMVPDPGEFLASKDPIFLRFWMMIFATVCTAITGFSYSRFRNHIRGFFEDSRNILGLLGATSLLVLGTVFAPIAESQNGQRPPDIFLISVDTLRADHLGCYGYSLPTSPTIDQLFDESIVFQQAMTSVPETIPAYTSIFTGFSPREHGVYNNFQKVAESIETLPERLHEQGYFSAAILDYSFPGTFSNLDQGFDLVVQRGIVAITPLYSLSDAIKSVINATRSLGGKLLHRDAYATADVAERWLADVPPNRPLFLHAYFTHPHAPYEPPTRYLSLVPPPEAMTDGRDSIHRYDGEIRYTDDLVSRVLSAIKKNRAYDESWIIFVADHGEELGRTGHGVIEPYFGHSLFVYDSSIRVPLIVRPPSALHLTPRENASIVNIASITATLLDAAGLAVPSGIEPPLLLSAGVKSGGLSFAVMRKNEDPGYDYPIDRVSVRSDSWRLIETRLPDYNLELLHYAGGRETIVNPSEHRVVVQDLLEKLHERYPVGEATMIDFTKGLSSEEADLLRSLGYLE
jgi:arylsulfatase A-like enzyme